MTIINDPNNQTNVRIRWADRKSETLLKMAQLVQGYWLDWSIHISEKNRFVYFDNPKVASGTLKWTLSKLEDPKFDAAVGAVHDRNFTPIPGPATYLDEELEHILFSGEYFRFAFVRNPFHRLLSAYFDKIKKTPKETWPDDLPPKKVKRHQLQVAKSKSIRQRILSTLGRPKDDWQTPISFADFVLATGLIGQEKCNPHWRLQSINLPVKTIDIDFIGRLENMSHDLEHVLSKVNHSDFDLEQTTELRYATNAKTKIQDMYDQTLIDAVGKTYQQDFESFGYPSNHL